MREEIESLLLIRQRLAGEIGFVKSRPGDHLSRPVGEEDEEPRGLAPQCLPNACLQQLRSLACLRA